MMRRFLTIQRHNATRAGLHYDLRIQDDSQEKNQRSWVIKKARLPDEFEKLLCIHVSDHPWSYRNFSGTLHVGYGAGTVELVVAEEVEVYKFTDKSIKFKYDGITYSMFAIGHGKMLISQCKPVVKFDLTKWGKK